MLCRYEAGIVLCCYFGGYGDLSRGDQDIRAPDYRSIVPTDWKLLPPDSGSHERRFVSPLGDAWLSLYAEPVDREPIPAHIERVRKAPGEMIPSDRREPSWIVVSGYKGKSNILPEGDARLRKSSVAPHRV